MTTNWNFAAADAYWRQWRARHDSPVWNVFESAEAYLLEHKPASASEAITLVDVLIDNIDQRPDGRDMMALRNLQHYLRSQG